MRRLGPLADSEDHRRRIVDRVVDGEFHRAGRLVDDGVDRALIDAIGQPVSVQTDRTEPRDDIGGGERRQLAEASYAETVEQRDEIDRNLTDLSQPRHRQTRDEFG
jgi:hypothetical protein